MELPDGPMAVIPGDWQRLPGLALYSGSLTYRSELTPDDVGGRLLLDLGDVKEAAEVFVNGRPAAVLLKHPYRCDISPLVRPGVNVLTVRVTGNFKSRYTGQPSPAGLFGPVRVLRVTEVSSCG